MLNSILAYVTFNIKALLKNKISFVWSIALPLVMFWIDKDAISSEVELIYWWVYMVLCSYIYGIGLYALELRESGSLRTIFSIQRSSWSFFLGNLLTQILFCIISIGIFDIVVIIAKGFSITHILFYSIYTILVCIPFAFLSYVVTLLPSVHADTDDFFCCDIWNVYAAKYGSHDQQVQSNVLYLANADAENHEQSDPV